MTDSQFETLRQELRALRSDIDQRFDTVDQRFVGIDTGLTRLEVQLDGKPDKAFVFQTLLTINATFIALIGLTLLVFRTFFLPE
jgi:hypothetical protein